MLNSSEIMAKKEKVGAVIVAAGSSRRMEGEDKIFSLVNKRTLLARTIGIFQECSVIDQIVVVLSPANIERGRRLAGRYKWSKVTEICSGGERRQDSVKNGLAFIQSCDWVVIHDGARPLISSDLIERGLEAARETGAAIAGVPVTDTIKAVDDKQIIVNTLERQFLWSIQTPQIFRFGIINEAYRENREDVTDDASLVEKMGHKVKIYPGSYDNIKVTTRGDLVLAKMLMRKLTV
ncbi:MAG: 2-C-methyl-D-erythritol 4-phosphate cytidylyltransferase [Dehalococcoidales bacterium]|nr:2-C-methyl-D-erythritol 4-phosphate cytidylyltransferase [Dehalococcoidales bacterium]